jgi:hypothetical protein
MVPPVPRTTTRPGCEDPVDADADADAHPNAGARADAGAGVAVDADPDAGVDAEAVDAAVAADTTAIADEKLVMASRMDENPVTG